VKTILLTFGLSFVGGIVVLACGALTVRSRATFKLVGIVGGTLIGLPCLLVAATVLELVVTVGGNPQALGFVFFLLVVVAVPLLAYAGIAGRRLEKLRAAEQPDSAMEGDTPKSDEGAPALPPDPSKFGRCPNCQAVIELVAARCPECPATFGAKAAWHVEPLDVKR
jgi:hypothetical protein